MTYVPTRNQRVKIVINKSSHVTEKVIQGKLKLKYLSEDVQKNELIILLF